MTYATAPRLLIRGGRVYDHDGDVHQPPHADILILISDCSRRGIQAAGRVARLVGELKLDPKVMKLIINRAPGGEPGNGILEEVKTQNLDLIGVLPQDDTVYRYDCDGQPSANVPYDAPVKAALREIAEKLGL